MYYFFPRRCEMGDEVSGSSDLPTRSSIPNDEKIESRIGPYTLLQRLGEGGMGEVWLAEQQEPLQRRVAIKLVKLGMDTREIVARFESERQALALMSHPSIARVYDAGATHQGRPYFVMEYVPGVPLHEYCDRERLSVPERLRLMMQVCAGVQHAHQKAVIHRDLKPSNVLVTSQDGKAAPKIIDFGIAKATGRRLTEKTYFTRLGAAVGTPEYMSPEQAEGSGQDVDTRTDVYALGVILYELLTGSRPFETTRPGGEGFDEIRRRIREEDPPKPSARWKTMGADAPERALRRQTEVSKIRRLLSRDLDWIVMKALDKDRSRRYGSPSELAADVERYLDHRPVVACPPSAGYRARKFVKRHRVGVAVAATGLAALIIVLVTITLQAARIARERDRANREAEAKGQIAAFLKDLFRVADPGEARGNTITAREILERGVEKIDDTLAQQPETRAEIRATIGEVYVNLGLYREAESLLRQAVDTQRTILGERHPVTLESVETLGFTLMRQGSFQAAQALYEELLSGRRAVLGAGHFDTLAAQGALANAYKRTGRFQDAERLFLDAMQRFDDSLEDAQSERLAMMNNLASLYRYQGRYAEAEKLDSQVVDIRTRVLGDDHPLVLSSLNNLATDYSYQGRFEEARVHLERAVEAGERVLGANHPTYGIYVHSLGYLYLTTNSLDEADLYLRRALSIYEHQPSHEFSGMLSYHLAQLSAQQGRADHAFEFLTRALDSGYEQEGGPLAFKDDPLLAPLRGEDRFAALVESVRRRNSAR